MWLQVLNWDGCHDIILLLILDMRIHLPASSLTQEGARDELRHLVPRAAHL